MPPVRTRHTIDNTGAEAVLDAAESRALEQGSRVVIAVVDPSGELLAFRRTPGAQVASSRVAVDKARTAAIFVRPSRELEEQVSAGRLGALALHGAHALTGGIPLNLNGEVVGAIGTSGETPDEDEAISIAGAGTAFSVAATAALTYEGARAAAEAVAAAAAERGVAPVTALWTRAASCIYLDRPDAAQVASVDVSTDKARTAAIYRRPSKDFEDQASGGRPSALHLARAVPLQGGIPILHDGEVVGAIGVSGASSADEDNELAEIGRRVACHGGVADAHPQRSSPAVPPPGPPELLPGKPDAIVDLQTEPASPLSTGSGATATPRSRRPRSWSWLGEGAADPLGPGDVPEPHVRGGPARAGRRLRRFGWRPLAPAETMSRLVNGLVSFNWYRIAVTIPERVGEFDLWARPSCSRPSSTTTPRSGWTVSCPTRSATSGGQVAPGFNAPNRVLLAQRRQARPALHARRVRHQWPDLGRAAQLHLDAHTPRSTSTRGRAARPFEAPFELERARRAARGDHARQMPSSSRWPAASSSPRGRSGHPMVHCSSARRTRTRSTGWMPELGAVTVFNPKCGYTGTDIGRYHQPGSNGLTFDPEGRLVLCQHGNRRVVRVNPHGDVTVLADSLRGPPAQLSERRGLPLGRHACASPIRPSACPRASTIPPRSCRFSGVFRVSDGQVVAGRRVELDGPTAWPSRPTSAPSTWATGTRITRW